MSITYRRPAVLIALGLVLATAGLAAANTARNAILQTYAREAGVQAFSVADGKALFQGHHTGGKPETPSCTTCHTTNPRNMGQTRAGKAIKPMAVSANPERFTDPAKVEKWLRRNCHTVLGRACTPKEKGDIITYLSSL
jgi:mono/diheme cytochrome c family protein